jgi:hypothetical protein
MATLTGGTRLGPYEIVEAIGAGGMGEVCRGRAYDVERDGRILSYSPPKHGSCTRRPSLERPTGTCTLTLDMKSLSLCA